METKSTGAHPRSANMTCEVKGTKAVITIDLGADALKAARPSSSGKTKLTGSTGGQPFAVGVAGHVHTIQVNSFSKTV